MHSSGENTGVRRINMIAFGAKRSSEVESNRIEQEHLVDGCQCRRRIKVRLQEPFTLHRQHALVALHKYRHESIAHAGFSLVLLLEFEKHKHEARINLFSKQES